MDEFFLHDRGVRESGHDTTYRFEGVCAYLATIDLNSLLYKYEIDIADFIKEFCDDKYEDPLDHSITTSAMWKEMAKIRQEKITKYMWDDESGFFFDYNTKSSTERHTNPQLHSGHYGLDLPRRSKHRKWWRKHYPS